MASSAAPPFLQTANGTLSIVGLNNFLVGLMVAGIIGELSILILVPIVNSAAVCLSLGMQYYKYDSDYPAINKAVASCFGGIFYLIQEAGLPFYGYVILTSILRGGQRVIFLTLFWALIFIITALKIIMLVISVRKILQYPTLPPAVNSGVHVGYYSTIAAVECLNAVFLLRKFRERLHPSLSILLKSGRLYRYLMRSTEIRVSIMLFIGIMRATVFPFNKSLERTRVGTQLDRFAGTLGCLFPIVM